MCGALLPSLALPSGNDNISTRKDGSVVKPLGQWSYGQTHADHSTRLHPAPYVALETPG